MDRICSSLQHDIFNAMNSAIIMIVIISLVYKYRQHQKFMQIQTKLRYYLLHFTAQRVDKIVRTTAFIFIYTLHQGKQ